MKSKTKSRKKKVKTLSYLKNMYIFDDDDDEDIPSCLAQVKRLRKLIRKENLIYKILTEHLSDVFIIKSTAIIAKIDDSGVIPDGAKHKDCFRQLAYMKKYYEEIQKLNGKLFEHIIFLKNKIAL